ncbi:MAG TPA: BadF/BadG/BcrA/BcrD ATPase family protein [Actinomycetota bacterium]|nr:BadF/BadG/BcrA/BcrD ATPase family protein [Actinomycetota bacterium]
MKPAAVLAIDGGGSKMDAVVLGADGELLGSARVPPVGSDGRDPDYLERLEAAVNAVFDAVGLDPSSGPVARVGVFCVAGADLSADERRILKWLRARKWTDDTLLRNDTFAVLRAGTDRTWGVGIVCGFGTNCAAVAPDGRTFRLPALGWIAGDWGGGSDLGEKAVWHTMRAHDGRGKRTVLATAVPVHFGLRGPHQVMEALYSGEIGVQRVATLAPVVFRVAAEGDLVARSLVERQADEVATMAGAAIKKLRMSKLDVDVVLGGGIFRNGYRPFFERIENGVRSVAPAANVSVLMVPPVVGAALLGLDRLDAPSQTKERVRRALTHDALAAGRRSGR